MAKSKTVSRPKIIARDWNGGLERARAALYKKYYTWITGHDGAFLYEKIIQQLYTAILEPGDTCIDVGANKGFHTFPMASLVGDAGKVYAFEPISELNAALVERAPARERQPDRVHPRRTRLDVRRRRVLQRHELHAVERPQVALATG